MADDVRADIEFLDAVRAMPGPAGRKASLASRLRLTDGDRLLEIGPGTGDDLRTFGLGVGESGLAVGVDVSPRLALEASARTRDLPRVCLVVADGARLPFRAESFTAANAERVLQHVHEPSAVVAELFRVLGSGGRVLLFEPDQTLRAFDHPDVVAEAEIRASVAARYATPTAGRQLFRLLRTAGFDVVSVDGIVHSATGAAAQTNRERAAGTLSGARLADYRATIVELAQAGALFSIWVAFEVEARRP